MEFKVYMKDDIRDKIIIGKYTVHYRKAKRGWAIIVMPNKFKVDNYYHDVHVHPNREILSIKDPDVIFDIICLHIENNNVLNEAKLRKELGL